MTTHILWGQCSVTNRSVRPESSSPHTLFLIIKYQVAGVVALAHQPLHNHHLLILLVLTEFRAVWIVQLVFSWILWLLLNASYVPVDTLFSTYSSYFLLSLFFYFSSPSSFDILTFVSSCTLTLHACCRCSHCSNVGNTVRAQFSREYAGSFKVAEGV